MDVCLPELVDADDRPAETAEVSTLLADCWVTLWSASEDSERAAHALCIALPLVTTDEARLN